MYAFMYARLQLMSDKLGKERASKKRLLLLLRPTHQKLFLEPEKTAFFKSSVTANKVFTDLTQLDRTKPDFKLKGFRQPS